MTSSRVASTSHILPRVAPAERIETFRDVAAVVREPVRLSVRRLRGSATVGRYHLRRSGLAIHMRHDVLADLATLVQTFRQDHYVPPPPAEAALTALGRPVRALDLGANIGMFGAWFLDRHPDGEVLAYEADPDNARIHSLTTDANRPRAQWQLVAAAAGPRVGEVRFLAGHATNSRLADASDDGAIVVPQEDVLERAGEFDLLKIDIEGAEWDLMADPRFAELPAVVVALEYHAARCPESDPRGAARRLLESVGYDVADGDLDADPGHGMVWGWKAARRP